MEARKKLLDSSHLPCHFSHPPISQAFQKQMYLHPGILELRPPQEPLNHKTKETFWGMCKLQVAKRNPGLRLGNEAQARLAAAAGICCCPGCTMTDSVPAVQGTQPDGPHTHMSQERVAKHPAAPSQAGLQLSSPHCAIKTMGKCLFPSDFKSPSRALTPGAGKSQLLITAPICPRFARLIVSQGPMWSPREELHGTLRLSHLCKGTQEGVTEPDLPIAPQGILYSPAIPISFCFPLALLP